MPGLLAARRRQIRAKGRTMTLERLAQGSSAVALSVDLLGVARRTRLDQLIDASAQADHIIETLDDELQAAGWPDRPKQRDRLKIDDRTFTVTDADPVYDGAVRIGWTIIARGA